MKIYVVTETEFEYNDEVYHETENGGGQPVEAYADKANADAACYKKCLTFLQTKDLDRYCYGIDEVIDVQRATDILGVSGDELEESIRDQSFPSLLQGKEAEIVECLEITPFKVMEIELNEAATTRKDIN